MDSGNGPTGRSRVVDFQAGGKPVATVTFDTHKFIRKQETAGFSPQQAQAMAEALKDVEIGQEFATRRDVEIVRQEARGTELRIDAKFEEIKGKLTLVQWMLALVVAAEVAPVLSKPFQ